MESQRRHRSVQDDDPDVFDMAVYRVQQKQALHTERIIFYLVQDRGQIHEQ